MMTKQIGAAGLKEVKGLNTLVLKNNDFTDLGSSLQHCTALSKLSMAHNQLSDLGSSLQVSFLVLSSHERVWACSNVFPLAHFKAFRLCSCMTLYS